MSPPFVGSFLSFSTPMPNVPVFFHSLCPYLRAHSIVAHLTSAHLLLSALGPGLLLMVMKIWWWPADFVGDSTSSPAPTSASVPAPVLAPAFRGMLMIMTMTMIDWCVLFGVCLGSRFGFGLFLLLPVCLSVWLPLVFPRLRLFPTLGSQLISANWLGTAENSNEASNGFCFWLHSLLRAPLGRVLVTGCWLLVAGWFALLLAPVLQGCQFLAQPSYMYLWADP